MKRSTAQRWAGQGIARWAHAPGRLHTAWTAVPKGSNGRWRFGSLRSFSPARRARTSQVPDLCRYFTFARSAWAFGARSVQAHANHATARAPAPHSGPPCIRCAVCCRQTGGPGRLAFGRVVNGKITDVAGLRVCSHSAAVRPACAIEQTPSGCEPPSGLASRYWLKVTLQRSEYGAGSMDSWIKTTTVMLQLPLSSGACTR